MRNIINNILYGDPSRQSSWTNAALLLLRLYAGITMASVGLDKLPLPDWMVDQVVSMGFPFPAFFAWIACFSEFAFGILIAVGLLTRISAFFLAFTMGVASFVFQGVTPIIDMHIAHHYVWTFVLFVAIGPGRWSLDHLISSKISIGKDIYKYIGWVGFFSLFALSFYIEKTGVPNPGDTSDKIEISSINIPGSFNNWDPSVIDMATSDGEYYTHDITFEKEGLVEFKFTANRSWDLNFGEENQEPQGFPVEGVAERDQGGNTQNIKVFIPAAGKYQFSVNSKTLEYEVNRADE